MRGIEEGARSDRRTAALGWGVKAGGVFKSLFAFEKGSLGRKCVVCEE